MKSRLTLNNLIAGLQTFFICMTLYAGEKGIMGYAGEKLIPRYCIFTYRCIFK
ncbi:MAG: hypothetical protein ACLRR3_01770 [Eubacterium sp.]